MIDICIENLTTMYLKEDIGYFRNMCQNQSMNLLTQIITYLRNKSFKVFTDMEKELGQDLLMKYLNDDGSVETMPFNGQDTPTEDLIFLAYTGIDTLTERSKIIPKVTFFLDISKNILDTLRSNSKLLDFYNDTARMFFDFVKKYRSLKEYKVVSETLHSHFNQIIKSEKNPELNSRIPYPIKLDEAEQVRKVLQIRKEQLELSIEMGDWTDAHKISVIIYQLMSRVSKKQTDTEIKVLYIDFYNHLSKIFWKSNLFLFHAYALYNIQFLTKALKNSTPELKKENNEKLVLAALSVPLNNKISNFERLAFNFIPEYLKDDNDMTG